jgi:hypothetical protein
MIRSRGRIVPAFLVLYAVLISSGCHKGPTPPRLVPVGGRVLYQGRPVPLAAIEFVPDSSKGVQGFAAIGQTKPDGTFSLQTYPYGSGAAPGDYVVTVTLEARGQGIPSRYADAEQTPLRIEVKEEGAPDLLLRLSD